MPIKDFFRQEVLDLSAYHLDEHPGIKLNQNESPWDIPVALKTEVVENLLKIPWNRYPLGEPLLLKKKLAKYLNIWPDNIVLANGSNVLVQSLMLSAAVGGKVMVLEPSFGLYEIEARLLGNKVHRFSLNDDFSMDADKIILAIKKERPNIIFIPNPNAPTGNLFDTSLLRKIIRIASCLVVIDEAYYPFSQTTLLEDIKEHDNLVVLRTFSKAYALGGLRLGFLAAEPEVTAQIQKCVLPFCVNKLAYATALTVLDNMSYAENTVRQILSERNRLFGEMKKLGTIKAYPTQANFILFEVSDAAACFKKLLSNGVIVRNVSDGRRLQNTLRVTVGSRKENDAFLAALKKSL